MNEVGSRQYTGKKEGTIVIVGMATRDTYFELDSLPVGEGKHCARRLGNFCGGMAANVAINLSILGHHVMLLHCVGSDSNGQFIEEKLQSHLRIDQIVSSKSFHSFASLIFLEVNSSKRLAILTDGEYPKSLEPPQVSAFTKADFIYCDGSWPIDGKLFRSHAGKQNVDVMVNLEFPHRHLLGWNEWADYGVHSLSYLGLNENSSQREIEKAVRASCKSNCKLAGVTGGDKGALFISKDSVLKVKAQPIKTIDTNGAGDAFQSGLIHALMSGWQYDRCLRYAATLAAVQCTVLGPNLGELTEEKIIERMESIDGWK